MLPKRLRKKRKRRPVYKKPPLTIQQILEWADEFHEQRGQWPKSHSGRIKGIPGETWLGIENALRHGGRGLNKGYTLARLLNAYRGVRNRRAPPHLTEPQIRIWVNSHFERTGRWPTQHSGPIADAPGETWAGVTLALASGGRGLPAELGLSAFLNRHRQIYQGGRQRPRETPRPRRLHLDEIVEWAKAHRERTGKWPSRSSGPIRESDGLRWSTIEAALTQGRRGLPQGLTIVRLLVARGLRPRHEISTLLTIEVILAWADAHFRTHGDWPTPKAGLVPQSCGLTWMNVQTALNRGGRSLPRGPGLSALLNAHRRIFKGKIRGRRTPPERRLDPDTIVRWAQSHRDRTGVWPRHDSGEIPGTIGLTWSIVEGALLKGLRGLSGGSSLARLLASRGLKRNKSELPPLNPLDVLAWADAHFQSTGRWPDRASGPINEAPSETWGAVDKALHAGGRGLAKMHGLSNFLNQHRRIYAGRKRRPLPNSEFKRLTIEQILDWAKTHCKRTGRPPSQGSGPVTESPSVTWGSINQALKWGYRGLPGGASLPKLLAEKGLGRNRPGPLRRTSNHGNDIAESKTNFNCSSPEAVV